MKTLFFVFTRNFVECGNEYLWFLVHTLEFKVLKLLSPQNLFMPPFQSRYPGAGLVWLVGNQPNL